MIKYILILTILLCSCSTTKHITEYATETASTRDSTSVVKQTEILGNTIKEEIKSINITKLVLDTLGRIKEHNTIHISTNQKESRSEAKNERIDSVKVDTVERVVVQYKEVTKKVNQPWWQKALMVVGLMTLVLGLSFTIKKIVDFIRDVRKEMLW